ncbi:MAG: DoxX family protein [Allosphingosinicella sp.]
MRDLLTRAIATPPSPFTDGALLVGRIMIVLALIPNGLRKIATFGPTAKGMGGEPQLMDGRVFPDQTPLFYFPAPELFLGVSIVFDLAGALLVILGLRTRAVSLFLAGYVLLAMTIFHSDIRHAQDVMHILRNLPFLAGLIVLAGVGPGHWSLDGAAARRPAPAATV